MSEADTRTEETDKQPVVIEKATADDAEAIVDVLREGWLDTYPNPDYDISEDYIRKRVEGDKGELNSQKVEKWRKIIESADSGGQASFVARKDGKVVGVTSPHTEDGRRRLGALYVLPEVQGRGIGSQLLQKAIEFHGRNEDIHLTVVAYNNKAIDFYKHHGFVVVGETEEDEGEPLPLINMVLPAIKPQAR